MSFLSQPITLQTVFGKNRTIGSIQVQVIISENTVDTLTITKQPVQQGASITDHSFKEPASFSCVIRQQDNNIIRGLLSTFNSNGLAQAYKEFQDLQNSRAPFDIVTPTRLYKNMLMASLGKTVDKASENILALSLTFQETIIVSVSTVLVPRRNQRNAGRTGATQNAGKKSALLSLKQGVGALFP